MVTIKRKVVQHGLSTLIISLPSKWSKRHNIKKGDELEVNEAGDKIIISPHKTERLERMELDIAPFGTMIPRTIHALYKRGVDELKLNYDSQATFSLIKSSLGEEAVGFEVLEAGKKYCVIKNVSEGNKEFNNVLRQTFLILMSMAEDGYAAIKQGNLDLVESLLPLERTNNRFTTSCRRYINTRGSDFEKIGPLYYIIERLECIADEYKYMYMYLSGIKKEKVRIDDKLLEIFNKNNQMLRNFYNVFYKFNPKTISEIKEQRNLIVDELYQISSRINRQQDIVVYQHLMKLTTDIFSLVGPYLIFGISGQRTFD